MVEVSMEYHVLGHHHGHHGQSHHLAISSRNVAAAAAACPHAQEIQISKTVNLFGRSEVLEEWQGDLPNDLEKSISKDLTRIVNDHPPIQSATIIYCFQV